MIDILFDFTNIPFYIYLMFFTFIFVGLSQRKKRQVSEKQAIFVPFLLIFLSIYAILYDFGISLIPTSSWLLAIAFVFIVNAFVKSEKEVYYCLDSRVFTIEGSNLPLFMMMLLFFTKYFVGVMFLNELPIVDTLLFITVSSFLYGVFTGMYLLRFLILMGKLKKLI